jgi:alpha-D-ribose 1-methylphosphonate 5-triphosphate synthase subunit PhnG
MEVCKKCHERDRKVIKCSMPIEDHTKWARGFVGHCDVCGRVVEVTYYCAMYDKLIEKRARGD